MTRGGEPGMGDPKRGQEMIWRVARTELIADFSAQVDLASFRAKFQPKADSGISSAQLTEMIDHCFENLDNADERPVDMTWAGVEKEVSHIFPLMRDLVTEHTTRESIIASQIYAKYVDFVYKKLFEIRENENDRLDNLAKL